MLLTLYFESMNGMRQFVAIALALNAFLFLKDDMKSIKGWLIYIGAVLIHTTAIAFLVAIAGMMFVKKTKNIDKIIATTIAICIGAAVGMRVIVNFVVRIAPQLAQYIDGKNNAQFFNNNGSGRVIVLYLVLLFILIFISKCIKNAVLLDRMNLSLKNGWQDENGNAYIICTINEIMDSIRCARQKAVKLLDELEHEYQLIERRRQGLGKPNLLYVKDLYAGLSQSNYWKYENQTSGGLKSELPGVWKSNGSKTDINNTDSSETDLIYSAQSGENISGEMREDERYRFYFQDKLEIPILEKNFPHDREILMEILELLVETVTSRKKFLRICGEEKPKEVVKSRLMKLDSMHIQYVMECLKSNTTQVRNIKQYLLATLYNAPTTIDSYYAAQVRRDFGWGGRSN